MKKRFCLIISICFIATLHSAALADLQSKIILKNPYSISNKINNSNNMNETGGMANSMLLDSSLGTMRNMINGMNGTSANAFNMQEMTKQQLDYAKQQAVYEEQMLKEDAE